MTALPVEAQAQALRQACAQLSLPLDEKQSAGLIWFIALLQRWNTTYNLTSLREPGQMLTQHVVDSMAAIPPLVRQLATFSGLRLMDVGSGGGLPGAVIALMCPALDVLCVDAVGKKVAFIRQVSAELGLKNLRAVHARVETLSPQSCDVIVARAFASLTNFVTLTVRHLTPTGVWMAMKGKTPVDEMNSLPAQFEVFHVEQLQVPALAADRCLVWMRPRPGAH